MKLNLLRRICGLRPEDAVAREAAEATSEAMAIERAVMKARAAIEEARRRRRTDTAIRQLRVETLPASGQLKSVLGLTPQELAILPDAERDALLEAAGLLPNRNGTGA